MGRDWFSHAYLIHARTLYYYWMLGRVIKALFPPKG
jgi:hypothetical protein